jgi:hypothetical protein
MCKRFFLAFAALFLWASSACWSESVSKPASEFQAQLQALADPFYLGLSDEQKPKFKQILELCATQYDPISRQLSTLSTDSTKLDQVTAARFRTLTWSLAGVSLLAILEGALLLFHH